MEKKAVYMACYSVCVTLMRLAIPSEICSRLVMLATRHAAMPTARYQTPVDLHQGKTVGTQGMKGRKKGVDLDIGFVGFRSFFAPSSKRCLEKKDNSWEAETGSDKGWC